MPLFLLAQPISEFVSYRVLWALIESWTRFCFLVVIQQRFHGCSRVFRRRIEM
jgi:hypothetical protein